MKKFTSLGWAGTGRMGYAMAERLLLAGHELAVWNRTISKAEPLAQKGAQIVRELVDLARSDVVFLISATGQEVKALLFGEGGLLSGDQNPTTIVDMTSMSPEESSDIREHLQSMGVSFIAAPVSGNAKVIQSGKLSIVVSGPEGDFHDVLPFLEVIGQSVTYVGEGELARVAKICHNVMLGVVTQNLCEILVLAESMGMKRSDFLAFLNKSAMGSMFTRYKSPGLVNLDFEVTFTPKLMLKDLDLGLMAARRTGVPMPTTSATRDQMQSLIGHGFDQDFSQLLLLEAIASGLAISSENRELDDGL